MNTKKLVVLAIFVFCCLGMVFAQGAREALEARGERIVITPEGKYEIEYIKVAPVEADRFYSLVGYDYTFSLRGDKIEFKYIDLKVAEALVKVAPQYIALYDYVSDARVEQVKAALQGILDVPSTAEKTGPGVITLQYSRVLTEAQFDKFVEKAKALIYDTIY